MNSARAVDTLPVETGLRTNGTGIGIDELPVRENHVSVDPGMVINLFPGESAQPFKVEWASLNCTLV